MDCDRSYFKRRAAEERAVAASALDREAREAHTDLAFRFEDLAQAIAQREYLLGLDLFVEDVAFNPKAPAGKLSSASRTE